VQLSSVQQEIAEEQEQLASTAEAENAALSAELDHLRDKARALEIETFIKSKELEEEHVAMLKHQERAKELELLRYGLTKQLNASEEEELEEERVAMLKHQERAKELELLRYGLTKQLNASEEERHDSITMMSEKLSDLAQQRLHGAEISWQSRQAIRTIQAQAGIMQKEFWEAQMGDMQKDIAEEQQGSIKKDASESSRTASVNLVV